MAEATVPARDDRLEELLNILCDTNKFARRKALNDLKIHVQQNQDELQALDLAKKLGKHLREEPIESCRQLTAEILFLLLDRNTQTTSGITESVIKAVCERLPSESSEELRLLYLKLIKTLVTQASKDALKTSLDSAFTVLILALKDGYHEVLKEACKAVCVFGKRFPELFQLQCESFVTHLVAGLKHRQGNVRVGCLEALGAVMVFGTELLIPQLSPHLKLQMSDNSPHIRQAAVTAAAESIHRPDTDDRYNHLLMPVLLIGTFDDFPDIAGKAEQYLSRIENTSLGSSLHDILETVRQDAEDWNPDVKLNAAKLLYATVHHFREMIEPKIRDVLILLLFQAGDDDVRVRDWAGKASSSLGVFRCPAALEEFRILLHEDEKISPSHFLVFTNLVLGAGKNSGLKSCADLKTIEILSILSENFKDSVASAKLLRCCQFLINTLITENVEAGKKLMDVLLNLGASNLNLEDQTCFDVIKQLAVRSGFTSAAEYFCGHADLFRVGRDDVVSWNADSTDWLRALFLIGHCDLNDIPFIVSIFPPLLATSTAPELRLKTFEILGSKAENSSDTWRSFFLGEIAPRLRENLHWKPGNAAGVLRSAATICWCRSFESGILPGSEFATAPLVSLIEDEEPRTRGAVVTTLSRLLNELDQKEWSSLTTALIGRLDDVNRHVRIAALRTLTSNFLQFDKAFDLDTLLLDRFLDLAILLTGDTDAPTAGEAKSVLKQMAGRYPEKVKERLTKATQADSVRTLLESLNL